MDVERALETYFSRLPTGFTNARLAEPYGGVGVTTGVGVDTIGVGVGVATGVGVGVGVPGGNAGTHSVFVTGC